MCGRLRCCLIYEYEHYVELRAKLPKKNKRVMTPIGEGKVIDVIPLRQRVLVEIVGTGMREFPIEELKLEYELPTESSQAAAGQTPTPPRPESHHNGNHPRKR